MNFLSGLLIASLSVVIVTGQPVVVSEDDDIVALPRGGGRWTLPQDCTTDCRYVEWGPVIEDNIIFRITGMPNGYIAMAISEDTTMGDDDVYYCTRASAESSDITAFSAQLVGFEEPAINVEMEPFESSITGAAMSCSFSRPVNVTKSGSGSPITWDLASDIFNMLYAEGSVDELGLIYHNFRRSTNGRFSYVSNEGYRQPPTIESTRTEPSEEEEEEEEEEETEEEEEPTPLPDVVSVNEQDNIFAIGENGGLWIVPNSECPNGRCKTISWEVDEVNSWITFNITGSSTGFVALAISEDMQMGPQDDCYYCARQLPDSNDIDVVSAYLTVRGPPSIVGPVNPSDVLIRSIDDTAITCLFRRQLSVTKTIGGNPVTWDLRSTNYNLLFAEGAVLNSQSIRYHSYRKHTNGRFSYVRNTGYKEYPVNGSLSELPQPPPPPLPSSVGALASGGGEITFQSGFVRWEPTIANNMETVRITMRGDNTGYIGVSFTTNFQGFHDCYYCQRAAPDSNQISLISAVCSTSAPPANIETISDADGANIDVTNTSVTCSFYRPISIRKMVNGREEVFDISGENYTLFYGEGPVTSGGGIREPTFAAYTSPSQLVDLERFRQQLQATTQPSNVEETTSSSSQSVIVTHYCVTIFIVISVFVLSHL